MISKHSVKIKFDAKSAFELGRHREVLERTKWASASSPASAAYIASLASVGQTDDAKVLFEERMDKLGKLCFSIMATNSNQLFPQNLLTQRGMQSIAVREWSGIAAQLLGIQGAS